MKTIPKLFLSLAAVAGFSVAAQADLIYTFDTGPSGTDGGGFNGGTYAWSSSLQAVQHTGASGGWTLGGTGPKFEFAWPSQTTMQGIANAGDGRVSFDLFVDGSSWTPGLAGWYQLHYVGNSDGTHGWTQDAGGGNPVDTWHNADDNTLYSWHFDNSFAQMGWDPGDSWFQLFFGSNSDSANPVKFYIDNIHVYEVPEPGITALAGLGIVTLLAFRRRNG